MRLAVHHVKAWVVALALAQGCAPTQVQSASPLAKTEGSHSPSVSPAVVDQRAAGTPTGSQPVQVRLPRSNASVHELRNALDIRVTDRQLYVAGSVALSLPPLEDMKVVGLGPDGKQLNEMFVPPLAEAVRRHLSGRTSAVLYVDVNTPFRALVEIVFTLSHVGIDRFLLATDSETASPPETLRGWAVSAPHAEVYGPITVLLVSDGLSVRIGRQNVAAGCSGIGPGLAIPKLEGAYDYRRLSRCLESLRSSIEHAATASSAAPALAQLIAGPGIPYVEIVSAMEAISQGRRIAQFQFKAPR